MSESVILIGGGGHAKVAADCVRSCGGTVVGILDDGLPAGAKVLDMPVLGKTADFEKFTESSFLIAIGNNGVRRRIAAQLDGKVRWFTAIHKTAVVSDYARIGAGTVVMPGAVINAGAMIGEHCIINTQAVVEHDNKLADFVHISPAAALGGTVEVGELTHIGIGAKVRNNINICGGCTIGAGAVIVKEIKEPGTYVGVPAVKII